MRRSIILIACFVNCIFHHDFFSKNDDFADRNSNSEVNDDVAKVASSASFNYYEKVSKDDGTVVTKRYNVPNGSIGKVFFKMIRCMFGHCDDIKTEISSSEENLCDANKELCAKKTVPQINTKSDNNINNDNETNNGEKKDGFNKSITINMHCGNIDDFYNCLTWKEMLKKNSIGILEGIAGGFLFCTLGVGVGTYGIIRGTFGLGKGAWYMGKTACFNAKKVFKGADEISE